MDFNKKRKLDDKGGLPVDSSHTPIKLAVEDVRKIIEPFTHEQLIEIIQNAAVEHLDVLESLRSIADKDPTRRKLFIRGLGWDTTSENLRSLFSSYGELDEAIVILDKATGKSKGFGFITFTHVDGALLALREPSKKIDGRMTVTQLAASPASPVTVDSSVGFVSSARKIYVANVPPDMSADRLLGHFSLYGEIEEGPLGIAKGTGKFRGWTLFVYKNAEAARAALVDPIKNIDGHQLRCKLANETKKGKPGGNVVAAESASVQGLQNGVPGPVPAGGPAAHGSVSGMYSGGVLVPVPQPSLTSHNPMNSSVKTGRVLSLGDGVQMLSSIGSVSNNPTNSSMGGVPVLSSLASQALPPSSVGPVSGYGGPYGGSHFGGHGLVSYGGVAGPMGGGAPMGSSVPMGGGVASALMGGGAPMGGVPPMGGAVASARMGGGASMGSSAPMGGGAPVGGGATMGGGVIGYGGLGQGVPLHALQQNSGGVLTRKSAHYSLSSSSLQQTEGPSSGTRIPTDGILHGGHAYYRGE